MQQPKLVIAVLLAILLGMKQPNVVTAESNETTASKPDVRKPVEPPRAASTFNVRDGFRIELVAAEPLVRDPMAMEIDENGVAYVLEIPAYNEYQKPEPLTPGSIARLEDTDGDGRYDRRTTFADDLKYPTGLFCYDGGIFVGDAPDLLYLKDTDGDGRADQRERLYTGFGAAQAGESQINSFRWSLDNRIRISTGLDGGDIRPAKEPDAAARGVRNRHLLLEPRTREFELTSGGGQHGMSLDDWGRVYVCDNSNPIEMIVYDDRYIERNPLMSAPAPVANLGPGAGHTILARISPPDAWRMIRDQLHAQGSSLTEPFEAGRASGVFTSSTGITVYRGDAWPDEFRGNVFVGEVANNIVYRARIEFDGLQATSHRADADAEFAASTDTWFRPAQFAQGPDGNLYVIDMYRELIEGIQWVPPEVLAEMDATEGSDRGRIFRIVPNEFQQKAAPRLGSLPTAELVQQLASRNGWTRDTAARLIYERQDKAAIGPLKALLTTATLPQARMHALYALDGLDALASDDLLRALGDQHPRVREHAIRLAEPVVSESESVRQALLETTDDQDIAVRLQLAFSLGALPQAERNPALLKLLRGDGGNSWFLVAIQSSLTTGAAEFVASVLNDDSLRQTPHAREFAATLANQVGRSKDASAVRAVVAAVDKLDLAADSERELARSLVIALLAEGAGASGDEILSNSENAVKRILADLLSTARTTALNQKEQPETRIEAIKVLGCGRFAEERTAFDELLAPQQPQPIQEAVVRILGHFSERDVVELLLGKWSSLTPGLRSSAAEVLLSRPAWAELLLNAVERKEVAAGDFDPARVALLKAHPSPAVRDRATTVFAGTSVARRADVVSAYQPALKLRGEPESGRAVFEKTCSACHVLEGRGTAVGADLRSIRDQGREAVMLNILDPNREINPKFLTYSAITLDGRTITGMIAEETPNNLTIRQADGTSVPISRTDIEEISSTGVSYMPEGLESQIDHQAMADLLAYLMTAETTPTTKSTE